MYENYYALAICIIRKCTPEEAFDLLEKGYKSRGRRLAYPGVEEELQAYREQGLSYQAIGELYGMSRDWVYIRLKKAREQSA